MVSLCLLYQREKQSRGKILDKGHTPSKWCIWFQNQFFVFQSSLYYQDLLLISFKF